MLIFSSLTVGMPVHLCAQYLWPVTPFDQTHLITGTFCEYRDTDPGPHYHNGVDIPKADGSPVYPVVDGVIVSFDPNGSNAFVRVNRFAYVHILPNPALSAGDSVFKSATVLGTILPGLGHVHLTDGEVGSETNALRENTGLFPYTDSWPPAINYVRFFQHETGTEFIAGSVSGHVDIVSHIAEKNGPPGSSSSVLNNGVYKLGYKILSADGQTVVYSPPNNGWRYQFDLKPNNNTVHNTFHPSFSNTSTHVYYVTNTATTRTFWDTAALPEGDYTVMMFAEDTRRNADTVYVPVRVSRKDELPPTQPKLLSVIASSSPSARWQANTEIDLAGYRLYSSADNINWALEQTEIDLPKTAVQADLSNFLEEKYFRLTAVDTVAPANESLNSDVYGFAPSAGGQRLLIVDGFDRFGGSGSWPQHWHWFVFSHGRALAANGFTFESCANEAVISGLINLLNYDAVFWLLGDESTADETFNATEQSRVRAYLQNGGNLFVSGSEVAWDLDTKARGSTSDDAFLRDYLKADYVSDDANSFSVSGAMGSIFDGLSFTYGSLPYPEDFPDAINAVGGGIVCLRYGNGLNAGVQFIGVFPGGNREGKLVYLGFPFETITAASVRQELMRRVLEFFVETTEVAEAQQSHGLPRQFVLLQNYPNPFNPSTTIRFGLPVPSTVRLEIYNLLGQRVREWPARFLDAGFHEQSWDGLSDAGLPAASGEYFLHLIAESEGKIARTIRLSLIK